jgi:hypothetical protein
MLRQGDAPKSALLEEFRLTPNAVLFATSSFWQGVDVQGEQLSCVIIDRLPFAVPSDPVVAARVKAIDAEGGNAFFQYQVPAAVITLKQGFGRLIRSLHDRGLLVLLDNRILKKQYGRVFIDSLPNYKKTTDLCGWWKSFSPWEIELIQLADLASRRCATAVAGFTRTPAQPAESRDTVRTLSCSLSNPNIERIELPRKVWSSIFQPLEIRRIPGHAEVPRGGVEP